jgi:3-deoxy-manno-octulosonate cytidylyltransferase (CMP-KDO synthetase)
VVQQLNWPKETCVVNVQGDEPCIPAELINQVAADLANNTDAVMATLANRIITWEEVFDPNLVKVVTDARGYALYFSRAAIPWHRDEFNAKSTVFPTTINIYRHIGLYAYRADFLCQYNNLPVAPIEQMESLEQLRALWHGQRIHISLTHQTLGPGIDVPSDVSKLEMFLTSNQLHG